MITVAQRFPPAPATAPGQIELITQPARIAQLLTHLQQARALLGVKIPGNADIYGSAVLKVVPEQAYLLLDELHPQAGHHRLLHSARAAIQARLNGAPIEFDADLLDAGRHAAIAFYRIAFPGLVCYTQRRRAHRVTLGPGQTVPLSIGAPGDSLYRGVLHDLSVTGVGAQFVHHAPPPFKQGELLSRCVLQMSPSYRLNSQLEVRFQSYDKFQSLTRLGGRFVGLEPGQQQLVQRTVAALERKHRRRQAG